jgi:hypothetical protein
MSFGNVQSSRRDKLPLDVEHLREILADCIEGSKARAREFSTTSAILFGLFVPSSPPRAPPAFAAVREIR